MTAQSSLPPASPSPSARPSLAFPGRLIVFLVFMTQFIVLLLGLGGLLPHLHEQGVSTILLAIGAVAAFAVLQALLSLALHLIPVRCLNCRGRARFAGFGWWPFIYRFNCGACGVQRRLEIGGR